MHLFCLIFAAAAAQQSSEQRDGDVSSSDSDSDEERDADESGDEYKVLHDTYLCYEVIFNSNAMKLRVISKPDKLAKVEWAATK